MNILWLSTTGGSGRGFWCQYLLEKFFEKETHYVGLVPEGMKKAVVIISEPTVTDRLKRELDKLDACLIIKTNDEENNFRTDLIAADNRKIFAQFPATQQRVDKWLPIGPSRESVKYELDREYDWCLMAQITDPVRRSIVDNLKGIRNGYLIQTMGFAAGLDYTSYNQMIARSKTQVCPPGGHNNDSFRVYETLEQGTIPIVFDVDYWHRIFPDGVPFPIVDIVNPKPAGAIEYCVDNFDELSIKCFDWWQDQKVIIRDSIYKAAAELGI